VGRTRVTAALALGLTACSPARQVWNSSEEFWAPIEAPPWFKEMEHQPLREVIYGRSGWWQYEVGRRYESGAQELPKDALCAAYWYQQAASSPYQYVDYQNGWSRELTGQGLPWGRIGLRRLRDTGVELPSELDRESIRLACSPWHDDRPDR
jgi:hypothetical protein